MTVSICVPNLNKRPFLPARIDSILGQTYRDWEFIAVDSYSEDGSWEYLNSIHFGEGRRVVLEQAPRGLYAGWNRCIALAKGDYIYIATSDDTMAPDCLTKMVAALTAHPECDMATCNILQIDEQGRSEGATRDWQSSERFLRAALERPHVRRAPFDLAVLFTMSCMPTSVTGVLFRRSVFEKVGPFPTEYGGLGDFVWYVRAAFCCDKVHVPEELATWRKYSGQTTVMDSSLATTEKVIRLLSENWEWARARGHLPSGVTFAELIFPRQLTAMVRALKQNTSGRITGFWTFGKTVVRHPRVALEMARRLVTGKKLSRWGHPDLTDRLIDRTGWRGKLIVEDAV